MLLFLLVLLLLFMLLSYNLLKKYTELPEKLTPQEVAERLTMATVEVEKVADKSRELDKVVVGKVEKVEAHPNADKLKIAWTDIGESKAVKIVCGGTNLREHMAVAVALPGAYVRWHGEGEPVELKKAKIRGEESYGMICAANEIGLFDMFPHKDMEIMDLTGLGLKPGTPLAEALHLTDTVFEIDNKSLTNRPDLWSHYGMARELSALYQVGLKAVKLAEDFKAAKDESAQGLLKINIEEKELCPRYMACIMDGVKVAESPEWLKRVLIAAGYRPINNIVDITNYVMLELGQPLHAFDKNKLAVNKSGKMEIKVRRAGKEEKFIALDGQEYKLTDQQLVIADSRRAIALAGIIGGADSAISQKTSAIVLEAANFQAVNIRRSSQQLALRTEASMRFEKSLDPLLAETALRRAVELIREIIPEAKLSEAAEAGEWRAPDKTIEIKFDFIIKRIGQKIDRAEISGILQRLGFGVEELGGEKLRLNVPSWRATGDVSIAEDIVEEVARVYGYDNLEEKIELVEMQPTFYQAEFENEKSVKRYLSDVGGLNEVFNYPWVSDRVLELLGMDKEMVKIANPPTEELNALQTSLIPNLLKKVESNLRFTDSFGLFELATVYSNKLEKWDEKMADKLPKQLKRLAGVRVGGKEEGVFFSLKGLIEGLAERWHMDDLNFKADKPVWAFIDAKRYLTVNIGREKVGWLGELDYQQLNFNLGGGVNLKRKNRSIVLFEFDWAALSRAMEAGRKTVKFEPLPQFPAVERDLAVVLGWEIKWAEIRDEISKVDKLIKEVRFLSEYPLADKKSLALRVVYQADERTLKDDEIEKVEQKILDKLKKKFAAELRAEFKA